MYFTSKQVQHLLANVRNLMCDRSVIWLDYVSHAAVNDMTGEPEALAFMESMRMVGEPFVWGIEDLSFFTNIGLNFSAVQSAANVLGSADPVMRHYSFVMCSANRAA